MDPCNISPKGKVQASHHVWGGWVLGTLEDTEIYGSTWENQKEHTTGAMPQHPCEFMVPQRTTTHNLGTTVHWLILLSKRSRHTKFSSWVYNKFHSFFLCTFNNSSIHLNLYCHNSEVLAHWSIYVEELFIACCWNSIIFPNGPDDIAQTSLRWWMGKQTKGLAMNELQGFQRYRAIHIALGKRFYSTLQHNWNKY